MPYDSPINNRRSIRLKGYDYSHPGAYFVTLVTHNRKPLFGDIMDGAVLLNDVGCIAEAEWLRTAEIRSNITLDEYVIMPNHIHAIIIITDNIIPVGATGWSPLLLQKSDIDRPRGPNPRSLGAIMSGFKSAVTKRVNLIHGTPGAPLWQRNYYDHIIRNQCEWEKFRKYIQTNPTQWDTDVENPNSPPQ